MAGTRGPVPKRSEERRRRNKDEEAGEVSTAPIGDVVIPDPDPAWHPIALRMYESLRESGQATFYTSSDYAIAYYVAEAMHRSLDRHGGMSGQLFAAIMSATGDLVMTEGARRRVRIELERNTGPDKHSEAADSVVTDFMTRLAKK